MYKQFKVIETLLGAEHYIVVASYHLRYMLIYVVLYIMLKILTYTCIYNLDLCVYIFDCHNYLMHTNEVN